MLLGAITIAHAVCTVAISLCLITIFWLCTRPWWDFHDPQLKPLFSGEPVIPLLLAPAALCVVYLCRTIKPDAFGSIDDLICFGSAVWICVPIMDRYVHLAEFMLFGPGGVDLRFSADAAMPAYWMTLNIAVAAAVMVGLRGVLRVVCRKIRGRMRSADGQS